MSPGWAIYCEDKPFKLLTIVVDVALKLLIDKVEFCDNEFKVLIIVVDVIFKLLILNNEFCDN